MIPKSVIHLFSGGLDSAVLLFDLLNQKCSVHCVLFAYGQKHVRELRAAKFLCNLAGVHSTVLTLPTLNGSALTTGDGSNIVPNRNAVFISAAVSLAMSAKAEAVTIACNKDDAANFPDCRPEFIAAMNAASKGAETGVEICAPYLGLTKREIVNIGRRYCVPMNETWSCYAGGEAPCGECDACKKRAEAMA